MENKKATQKVSEGNVSIETVVFYAEKHKKNAHLFGLCVVLPYLCPRKLKKY